MKTFSNKVAVITGAASGIGLASARAFAKEGMHIVLLDNREGALQTAREKPAERWGQSTGSYSRCWRCSGSRKVSTASHC